jgi:DNA-binding NarL/FixJ family response regulator
MSAGPVPSKTTSIVLVDDHQLLTDALTAILHSEPDLRVVGVAETCAAARERLRRICPDVLLLDVSLPDGDGISLVPEFNRLCPGAYILVLTSFSDEKTLTRAIETGVNGFVSKERPLSEIIAAIRQAAEGEIVMPASLLVGLLGRLPRSAPEPAAQANHAMLTPREREILALLAQGLSGAQIAAELNIALLTVRTHVRNLLEKLGVHSRLEAVSYALRHGLIEPPLERQALRAPQTPRRH